MRLSSFFLRKYKLMHPKEPLRQLSWDKPMCDVESKDLAAKTFAKYWAAKCLGKLGESREQRLSR